MNWRMTRYTYWMVLAVLSFGPEAAGATWHVDDSNTSAPWTGADWDNPFQYLQDALDAATAGDTIKVAQGTYHPDDATQNHTEGDRSETFLMQSGVVIQGGYIGYDNESPPPDTRDWELY
ncbi:hypothetical protein LCGC14_2821470, partial [marine sediment metagenome]